MMEPVSFRTGYRGVIVAAWVAVAVLVLVVTAGVLLAGKGGDRTPSAALSSASPSGSASRSVRQVAEEHFAKAYEPFAPGVSRANAVALGWDMCGALGRAGGNASAVAAQFKGSERAAAVELMLLASQHLCTHQYASVVSWKVAEDARPPAEPTAKPTSTQSTMIEEGIWTVGVDVPPGTYRVTEAVTQRCYWAITKSGTNGEEIISNDLPSGGRPSVTLKKGQDFTSHRCGTWQRTK